MYDRLAKAEVVCNTLHDVLIEGVIQQVHGGLSVSSPCDQLADHRVVVHGDLAALLDTCVDSDVFVRVWLLIFREEANGWEELTGGIFSVYSVLN